MKYTVLWTKTALKKLKKLKNKNIERIIEKVEEVSDDPIKFFKKLTNMPLYSLRIGKYRVIATIDTEKHSIIILTIEHGKRAYKTLK